MFLDHRQRHKKQFDFQLKLKVSLYRDEYNRWTFFFFFWFFEILKNFIILNSELCWPFPKIRRFYQTICGRPTWLNNFFFRWKKSYLPILEVTFIFFSLKFSFYSLFSNHTKDVFFFNFYSSTSNHRLKSC